MENFRSKSCKDVKDMQLESYSYGDNREIVAAPSGMNNMRSYSTNFASSAPPSFMIGNGKEIQMKKVKNNQGSIGKSWSFNDPEMKRKKRVAGYKVYAVEGKMKGSLRKSFRWIKDIVYGWRSWKVQNVCNHGLS
ncbi:Type 1 diacylglycerol acyltransferase [Heracleum sosnowskyi]|uniref:Type 1 diacylglycerol acyltransferase n=1 Tax=Heracleum sosnowskyi TaxID=360622 RepID=A0AAD8I0W4_9APIA|nr:Type 1 diacylglycerol acyltransferase [Heracleum sosnowskyi]